GDGEGRVPRRRRRPHRTIRYARHGVGTSEIGTGCSAFACARPRLGQTSKKTDREDHAMDQPVGRCDAIQYEIRGRVAGLTLNRPERLNAISAGLRNDVHAAVERARDDDEIRALVITGAGRGFCSGADLLGGADRASAGRSAAPPEPRNQNERLDEMNWVGRWAKLFYTFDKPLIGAINGVAAGAGMSLALACDVRIGSDKARFKTVFVERNLSPDSGMSFFLPRIVGYARAADLIFTSRAVE